MNFYSKSTNSLVKSAWLLKEILWKKGRTWNTSTWAVLPRKNHSDGHKQSFKNIPQRIKKCKNKRKIENATCHYNFTPNNAKSMPVIKQTLRKLKTLDRLNDALDKVKFIDCKRQAPNLILKLCWSSSSSTNPSLGEKNYGKNCICF